MTRHSDDRSTDGLQRLSALMDGEVDGPIAVGETCAAWRDDSGLRASWHAWHVIGDVLRSEDLVRDARGDAAFLSALRGRLQNEPVVLAPQPAPVTTAPRRSRGWSAAGAIAAGLAVVAVGSGVLMQQPNGPAPQPVVAAVPAAPARAQVPVVAAAPAPLVVPGALQPVTASVAEPQVLTVDGELIRDARLDRYLAAHKPFSANPALAVQSGFAGPVRARQSDR